jgi:hypothetical protein
MLTTNQSYVTYQGNGATTQFPFLFIIPSASDAVVSITNIATQETTLLAPTQYSISGTGPGSEFAGGSGPGGIVTYPTSGSPLPIGWSITIQRVVPYTQNTSLTNQGAFYPEVVEQCLDALTMQTQQLSAQTSGAVPLWAVGPPGETGATGEPGAQGETGLTGEQGPPGSSNCALVFSGLIVQNDASLPTTKVDITAGSIVLAPSYNAYYNVNAYFATGSVGANGMDVPGPGANPAWIHCYVIYNPTTLVMAGLGTLVPPVGAGSGLPTLPSGFTQYRYVGSNYWSGTALVYSQQVDRDVLYDTPIAVAGPSAAAESWLTVGCNATIPPTATRGYFQVPMWSTGSSQAWVRRNGSSTNGQYFGEVTAASQQADVAQWVATDSAQNVQITITATLAGGGTWSLWVLGYKVNL